MATKMTVKDTIKMLNKAVSELQQFDDDAEVNYLIAYPNNGYSGDPVAPLDGISVEYEETEGESQFIGLGIHY